VNKSLRTGAVLALSVTALAGCKAVGPDFQPPAPPKTAAYLAPGDTSSDLVRMTPDARVAGAWWKSFRSADLDRVMETALRGNPSLAEADASLARMRELTIATHGAQLPQVDVNANTEGERINLTSFGFKGFPGIPISNPTLGLYSIGGQVTYDVDLFGGLRRSTEAARANSDIAARQADAAYLALTGQTAMAAMRIATIQAEIDANKETIADDQRLVDIVHKAAEAGGEAPSAANTVIAQLAQDQATLPRLELQLAQSRHALAQLVGEAPADWSAPDFQLASFTAPANVPVSLPSALVRRRPDILVAEADLHVATAQIGVATAALYPDIRLTANIAQTALVPGNLFAYNASGWELLAGVAQPVFHGGALRANRRAAVDEANAALARYRGAVLGAFTQVADVMEAIAQDDAELKALAYAEDTAAKAVRDDELAYRLGGGALLTVMDDQRRLALARRAAAEVKGRRLADIAQLYVATAADWGHPTS
jgi:NodT family efflux transporter outer membrane factor (OMF) lipoprotein